MVSPELAAPLRGPGLAPPCETPFDSTWSSAFPLLPTISSGAVAINLGWDLDWERHLYESNAARGREYVSVRVSAGEVVIGPRWVPGTDSGCPACAEVRGRTVLDHPLLTNLSQPCALPRPYQPLLPELLIAALRLLADRPLRPGELYAVGGASTRRHRIPRNFYCPLCTKVPPAETPAPLVLRARPHGEDPTREADGALLIRRGALRERLVDPRFGPVRAILRESHTPFAMSMAVIPDAPAMGHGRGSTFTQTEPVAVLEGYERLGGFPFNAAVHTDLSYTEIADEAVDPATLGQYTREQLDHPTCRVIPSTPATRMDWVRGHDLDTRQSVLVPADVGFYQYEYRFKLDRRAARAAGASQQLHYFHESSSGCAVGAGFEEAALHALFEVAERDAFQLSWHRAQPLPAISQACITDPVSRAMIDLIHSRGFDVHLLVATQDIVLPVVWVLAINRTHGFPAAFSSAGSGADPADAVRGGLREVAQLVTNELDWTRADIEAMVENPWQVQELEDHVRLYSLPETLSRSTAALGGPEVTLDEAFPDWPDTVTREARGHVRGALEFVASRFADAGLRQLVLVDQTSQEHADAGIAVVKAVVPGSIPMCFGHAQQRLQAIPRLTAALVGTPMSRRAIPYDPHPFP